MSVAVNLRPHKLPVIAIWWTRGWQNAPIHVQYAACHRRYIKLYIGRQMPMKTGLPSTKWNFYSTVKDTGILFVLHLAIIHLKHKNIKINFESRTAGDYYTWIKLYRFFGTRKKWFRYLFLLLYFVSSQSILQNNDIIISGFSSSIKKT